MALTENAYHGAESGIQAAEAIIIGLIAALLARNRYVEVKGVG
jgi:hypothetical protein